MNRFDLLGLAQKNLWRRKIRTILTTLGVVIGTTSIVVMLSLGIGLNEMQRQNMERWGSLTMIRVQQGMIFDDEGNPLKEGKQLNDEAVEELKGMEGVVAVSPAYYFGGEARFGRKRGSLTLVGLEPETMAKLEFTAWQGRLLEENDRNVMVVGKDVINRFRDEAFIRMMREGRITGQRLTQGEEQDPSEMLNQRVSMTMYTGNRENKRLFNFLVVGILEGERTENSSEAFVPIEDLRRMRRYMSTGNQGTITRVVQGKAMVSRSATGMVSSRQNAAQRDPDAYDYILVRAGNVEQSRELSETIKKLGYSTWSMVDQLEGIEKTSRTIQAILGGIGSITLLVAALGITNTMIMSIYERTREIGIMKVIGASFRDIHALFLAEAGLIGFFGGAFGLVVSYVVSYVINQLSRDFMNRGMPPGAETTGISLIPPWLALFALAFSVMVGIAAGLYPAYRAVRLSPINAIRNE
ncbi:MAG: ABC transporter permease [Peptococcaceae bacterium]|jgi:ABC-type antimicrobial peptide transport system permease subunit|nr:ABC transporter permease [Peptococcaceae bacterium]MDH7524897.1 ABC transporter permease [Peptococcaceae bacterium]